ncbi:MAG: hypothetical protein J1F40_09770, partial [Prevotellaceae bacterium]|nr:hypothetical protein [Prevotellaceae bacterium]
SSNGNYIWNIEETEIPAPVPEVYTVSIAESENGTVTSDVSEAQAGETVTLTVTRAEGYGIETLTVTCGEDGTGVKVAATEDASVYTFTMPESDVTVSATFAEISQDTVYYWYVGWDDPRNVEIITSSVGMKELVPGWHKIGTEFDEKLYTKLNRLYNNTGDGIEKGSSKDYVYLALPGSTRLSPRIDLSDETLCDETGQEKNTYNYITTKTIENVEYRIYVSIMKKAAFEDNIYYVK